MKHGEVKAVGVGVVLLAAMAIIFISNRKTKSTDFEKANNDALAVIETGYYVPCVINSGHTCSFVATTADGRSVMMNVSGMSRSVK